METTGSAPTARKAGAGAAIKPVYLDWRQVAALCSSGEKCVSKWQVLAWTRQGVSKGLETPVKLRSVELPGGQAWTREDVEAFLDAIAEGRAAKRGDVVRVESLKLVGAGAPAAARRIRASQGFRRCAPELIGTHVSVVGHRRAH